MPFAHRAVDGGRYGVVESLPAVDTDTQARTERWSGLGSVVRVVATLPVAFVVLVAVLVVLTQAAALVGLRPLSSVWGAVVLVAAALLPTAWVARAAGRQARAEPLGLLPAGLLTAYGLTGWLLPDGRRVEWFLGGDHVRHLLFVAEEAAAGRLSYADQTYPRGWHTLVASLWRAGGGGVDAAGLASLVDLMSSMTWLLPALLAVATATGTTALAGAVGLNRRATAWASLAAATALLLPDFLGSYQALGFENSYVAAIVTAVVACELVNGRGNFSVVVVCAAGAVVGAHAWQLLLPGMGLALLLVSAPLVRDRARLPRVAIAWVVAVAAAWPALAALVSDIGLHHATDSDVEAPYSVVLVASACIASVGLATRRGASLWSFAGLVLLPGLTAFGLAVAVGVGLDDYYPSKLFWQTSVLGLQATAVGGALLVSRGGTTVGSRLRQASAVALTTAAGLVGLYAAISPLAAYTGAWSTVEGRTVLAAITTPDASSAQVVWLGTEGNDTISRILLDFYRAGATTQRTPQPPLTVEQECALLREADRPAVLSNRSGAQVSTRYACAPDVTVVRVVGSP